MDRKIEKTPEKIVEGGELRFGTFEAPFRNVNLIDAPIFGGRAMRWRRRFRLKEWVGFFAAHPDIYFALLIQDSKYLSSSTFFAYDRRTGRLFEHMSAGAGSGVRLAESTWDNRSLVERRGHKMEFRHLLAKGRHEVQVEIEATKKAPAVRAELTFHEDLSKVRPLVVSLPVRPNHSMYTHKAPLPVEGVLRLGEEEFTLDPARDLATLDEHKAFYPYHTKWRWATFAGYDERGRVVGLNICDHITKEPEHWNENCIWAGGELSLLGPARFEFDTADTLKPWRITESGGQVEIDFYPEGRKTEKRNFLVASIDYSQQFGRFEGFLVDDAGERHAIEKYYGVAEKMDTRF